MRSIWISIRAMNYTDRATRQVGRNIDYLMRKQNELRRNAVMMMSAGIMWTVMGALAMMGIMKIGEASTEGRRAIRTFSRSTDRLMKAFGTAFVRAMGPAIKLLTAFFNWMSALDPRILQVIASIILAGVALVTLKGATMAVKGAIDYLTASQSVNALATGQTILANYGCATSTMTLGSAFAFLRVNLGKALIIFTIFMSLGQILGREGSKWATVIGMIAMAIWGLAVALKAAAFSMSVLTFGAAAIAGIAAMAAMPSYQYGTRMVQRTGPAIVHAGDVITRPDRGDRTPQQEERGFPKNYYNVTLSFGDVKTKADKEELRPLILKALKDALNNKV